MGRGGGGWPIIIVRTPLEARHLFLWACEGIGISYSFMSAAA